MLISRLARKRLMLPVLVVCLLACCSRFDPAGIPLPRASAVGPTPARPLPGTAQADNPTAAPTTAPPALATIAIKLPGDTSIEKETETSATSPPPTGEPAPMAAPATPPPTAATTPAPTTGPTTALTTGHATSLVGRSAGGRPIESHRLGTGAIDIVIVGGIHGGYEWNSVVLAEELLSHYQRHTADIPPMISLHFVPNANPDGLSLVTDTSGELQLTGVITDTFPARFNANGVDLNRNWDCAWAPTALWREKPVSAGTHPFSEPETESLSRYLVALRPVLVIFLHSAANAVYASGCAEPHQPSYELATIYGRAAEYPVFPVFDHYTITGDASDWLSLQSIPSFTVELSTHESLDWERNLAGMKAILAHYSEPIDLRGAE